MTINLSHSLLQGRAPFEIHQVHFLYVNTPYKLSFALLFVLGTDIVAYHDISCNTIRCTDCMVLVPRSNTCTASRYEWCRDYRKNLSGLLTRYRNGQTKHLDGSDPQSHTNYRYLSTPEKDKCLQRLHHQYHMSEKSLPAFGLL